MVTEERFDRQEEDKRLVPAASQGIASAGEKHHETWCDVRRHTAKVHRSPRTG